jgi:hypothetical protein
MSEYPLASTSKKAAVRKAEPGAVEPAPAAPRSGGFFSFRYSHTAVSSRGGRTRVEARQERLEEGKLSTEVFEGEFDGPVYDELVRQAQQHVLDQMTWWLRLLRAP